MPKVNLFSTRLPRPVPSARLVDSSSAPTLNCVRDPPLALWDERECHSATKKKIPSLSFSISRDIRCFVVPAAPLPGSNATHHLIAASCDFAESCRQLQWRLIFEAVYPQKEKPTAFPKRSSAVGASRTSSLFHCLHSWCAGPEYTDEISWPTGPSSVTSAEICGQKQHQPHMKASRKNPRL